MNAPAPARRDRLRAMLADLKMPGALEAVDGILSGADGGTISAAEAIEQLLNAEIVLRNNRRLQTAAAGCEDARSVRLRLPAQHQARAGREPAPARLPGPRRERDPARAARRGKDSSGDQPGDCHGRGRPARLLRHARGLIESLTEAKAASNLSRRLRVLTHPALLVVDEIGYMPVNQDGEMKTITTRFSFRK